MLLAGLLAACASQPESRETVYEQAEENTEQTPAAIEPEQPEPGQRQASNSLLTEARLARAEGALDRADSLLQRALRIDSANADVYIELAQLYTQRGRMEAARNVAQRGLLYCDGKSCASLRKLAAP